MTSLFDAAPYLAEYKLSFAVLAVLSLATLIQSFMSAPLSFLHEEQTPGMPLQFDHTKLSFRVLRTYSNSVEILPAFGWALLVTIVAGAPPTLVNFLALAFLVFRLAFWAIYYSGVGKVAGGPRTMAFVGGMLTNIVLAAVALWTLAA